MVCKRSFVIGRALEIAEEMIRLADDSETGADDGCCVLCGVIRDCSYKIKKIAELERRRKKSPAGWHTY